MHVLQLGLLICKINNIFYSAVYQYLELPT